MQYIIKRTDFLTIIEIKTGFEQITKNIYKVKPYYYDSTKHLVKTSRELWDALYFKFNDTFIFLRSLNPERDVIKEAQEFESMIKNQYKTDEELKTGCENILNNVKSSEKFIDFNDPERIEKINNIIRLCEEKRQKEREEREKAYQEKIEKEKQLKFDKFKQRLQERKIFGSDLQEYIYPAVKNDCKIPLKTLGSLFALFYIVIDENYKPIRYCMEKKRKK